MNLLYNLHSIKKINYSSDMGIQRKVRNFRYNARFTKKKSKYWRVIHAWQTFSQTGVHYQYLVFKNKWTATKFGFLLTAELPISWYLSVK